MLYKDIIMLCGLMCLFKLLLYADHFTKCCIRSECPFSNTLKVRLEQDVPNTRA